MTLLLELEQAGASGEDEEQTGVEGLERPRAQLHPRRVDGPHDALTHHAELVWRHLQALTRQHVKAAQTIELSSLLPTLLLTPLCRCCGGTDPRGQLFPQFPKLGIHLLFRGNELDDSHPIRQHLHSPPEPLLRALVGRSGACLNMSSVYIRG